MLWLAGLMGLLAAGTAGVLEMTSDKGEAEADDDLADIGDEEETAVSDVAQTLNLSGPEPDAPTETDAETDASDPASPVFSIGTEGADELDGTAASETLFGEEGDDTVSGLEGADTLHGDDGNDLLSGGDGDDDLYGHNDNDTLDGGAGDDALQGSAGDDVVLGGDGNDAVQGGLDDDTVSGGLGADSLFGGHGNDVVNGVEDAPETGEVDDADEADYLNGGSGDDTIIAGNGDIVTAGDGADDIVLGGWISEGGMASILDFNAEDDNILLVYDDADAVPEVTVQPDPENPGSAQVFMDGVAVANVSGGAELAPEDIVVMPLSLAQSTGMAPP